jgi:hypothetical protein
MIAALALLATSASATHAAPAREVPDWRAPLTMEGVEVRNQLEQLIVRRFSAGAEKWAAAAQLGVHAEVTLAAMPTAARLPAPRRRPSGAAPRPRALPDLTLGVIDAERVISSLEQETESLKQNFGERLFRAQTERPSFRLHGVRLSVGVREDVAADAAERIEAWVRERSQREFGELAHIEVYRTPAVGLPAPAREPLAGTAKASPALTAPADASVVTPPVASPSLISEYQNLFGLSLISLVLLIGIRYRPREARTSPIAVSPLSAAQAPAPAPNFEPVDRILIESNPRLQVMFALDLPTAERETFLRKLAPPALPKLISALVETFDDSDEPLAVQASLSKILGVLSPDREIAVLDAFQSATPSLAARIARHYASLAFLPLYPVELLTRLLAFASDAELATLFAVAPGVRGALAKRLAVSARDAERVFAIVPAKGGAPFTELSSFKAKLSLAIDEHARGEATHAVA